MNSIWLNAMLANNKTEKPVPTAHPETELTEEKFLAIECWNTDNDA